MTTFELLKSVRLRYQDAIRVEITKKADKNGKIELDEIDHAALAGANAEFCLANNGGCPSVSYGFTVDGVPYTAERHI